jgi:hypothetical protein
VPQNRLEVQQTQKLSQSMQTVIHMLSMDLDALSDYIQKAIEENPALELVPPPKSAQDYALFVRSRYRSSRGEYRNPDAPAPVSTADDLAQQLRLAGLDTAICRAATRMLHTLSSRGYFTQDLEAFAAEAGISADMAAQALTAVQALEPAGIGARSVEECLCLQLRQLLPQLCAFCFQIGALLLQGGIHLRLVPQGIQFALQGLIFGFQLIDGNVVLGSEVLDILHHILPVEAVDRGTELLVSCHGEPS